MCSCGIWRLPGAHLIQLLLYAVELGFVSDEFHRLNAMKEFHLHTHVKNYQQSVL